MWDAIKDGIFAVIQAIANIVGDWGLAIIIITIIFRLLLTPLMHKQAKSTYMMKKLTPEIEKIKERFPDDKTRQNQETNALYAETKYNPLAGCVPMLIQIPIFIALFQTLREMGGRAEAGTFTFYFILPDLTMSPADVLGVYDIGTFVCYLVFVILFAVLTFIPMIIAARDGAQSNRNQTYLMSAIMSLMMLWFGWSSPAGVLLFWVASSAIALIQNEVSRRILEKEDEKREAEKAIKPIKVDVTRKEKKKRQTKKR